MEKFIAWGAVFVAYVLWMWVSTIFTMKNIPYWLRVLIIHLSAGAGVLLGMLISWVITVLIRG